MNIYNLTQSHTQNDPINHWIHGFLFCDFKDEDGVQNVISPYSLDQFLISNTPQTRKRVKKVNKLKDSQNVVSRQFNLLKNSRVNFRHEGQFNL